MTETVPKPKKEFKYEMVIRRAKEIIATYSIKLTLRQLYYRLVANNDIKNNASSYNYYDKIMTQYRQKNNSFAEYFEDKTRSIGQDIDSFTFDNYTHKINMKLEEVKTSYPYYWVDSNKLQSKITIILLEKQALETIFQNAIGHMSILVVARGFNSFTQMNELKNILKGSKAEKNLYVFTDFDDSGLLIQNNFLNQMRKYLKVKFDNVERIALTKDLIEHYSLPHNPVKESTHKKFKLPYYVELDALEPNILTRLVSEVCEKNYDKQLNRAINKAIRARNRRMKKQYFRRLREIDFSDLS